MSHHDSHADVNSKTIFGFWVYLLTDFMMFAALFATYAVLHHSTYGGPAAWELFHLSEGLTQSLVLLTASFLSGVALVRAYRGEKGKTVAYFLFTFFLGTLFLIMQIEEWSRLLAQGAGWQRSAFLSAYFTLVGTHVLHVLVGLLWTFVLLVFVWSQGLTDVSLRRLTCLKMFWQFLNVVWIFIFTMVYLMGEIRYV